MRPRLKPLAEQTFVITGATSGHGLATALRAAAKGASVLLVARDEDALRQVAERITAAGGEADWIVADVGVEADVERVFDQAMRRFGGFTTWVNNAGVGIYGELMQTPTEDHHRLFETNYWGVVYGSLAAVRHLRTRPDGGALINVGSVNGDMPTPLLGAYNASKHAVKGFTDSLRLELIGEGAPVSVTLIKPSAIGTPFPRHGRNFTGHQARLPQPVYSPELVADGILFAAQHPRRALTIGGAGRLQVAAATLMPSLFDQMASRMGPTLADPNKPVDFVEGSLDEPGGDEPDREGRMKGRRYSLYTAYKINPATSAVVMAAGGLLIGGWLLRRSGRAAPLLALAAPQGRRIGRQLGRQVRAGLSRSSDLADQARHRLDRLRA